MGPRLRKGDVDQIQLKFFDPRILLRSLSFVLTSPESGVNAIIR
jgi:hypothetical protein